MSLGLRGGLGMLFSADLEAEGLGKEHRGVVLGVMVR